MGYERNDRRYGGGYTPERDRYDTGAPSGRDRATSYGYGSRDYRGNRFDDSGDYGRDDYGRSRSEDPRDRGFIDRAGDEVRSWFGDEDAERRRREDAVYDERTRSYGSGPYNSEYGYRGNPDREYSRGSSNYASSTGGYNRPRDEHEHGYHSWRGRQLQAFDRDYDEYRRQHQDRFDNEFGSWRQNRQGQRDQLKNVQEHQEVVGSDGAHVGKVDHIRSDHILLAKNDPAAGGHHHAIPSSWIQSVDDKVTLNRTADQAKQHWRDEDRNGGSGGLFGNDRDGNVNLNKSFSGTY